MHLAVIDPSTEVWVDYRQAACSRSNGSPIFSVQELTKALNTAKGA